jgi:hypothetical protein
MLSRFNFLLMVMFLFVGIVASFNLVSASSDSFTFNDLEELIQSNTNGTIDLPSKRGINFNHNIKIDKKLKINGNGLHCTGGGFDVVSGGNLELSDFDFESLTIPTLVTSGGVLTCDNCNFISCYDTINILGGSVLLNNSNINHGSKGPQIKIKSNSHLEVNNTIFFNNNFTRDSGSLGSCIYGYGGSYSVNISNSSFKENHGSYGGALAFNAAADNVNISIHDCEISNNFATASGGFLYTDGFYNYTVRLINNTFNGNAANKEANSPSHVGHGSCVLTSGYSAYEYFIEDNKFTKNEDKYSNSVLSVYGNCKSTIHGYGNVLDGTGRLSCAIDRWNCNYVDLDIDD